MTKPDVARQIEQALRGSPLTRPFMDRWAEVDLPDAWLVAGVVAQTVWNAALGLDPTHGVSDVDLIYFDGADLSESSEAAHGRRIRSLFGSPGAWIDVKNQARVHTWYERKFGCRIQPYTSATQAITTFPTTATAIGVRPAAGGLELFAPFGVDDLMTLRVRPNRVQVTKEIYEAKVGRWTSIWPDLHIEPW